jgi:hypothetical protein
MSFDIFLLKEVLVGHPLKGPLSREKLLHRKKSVIFLLRYKGRDACRVRQRRSLSLPLFLGGGVDGPATQISTAPVTHQDQGIFP